MNELTIKIKVDFAYCSRCGKKPINYKTKTVEKFLQDHRRHSSNNKLLKVVGFIVRPKTLKKYKLTLKLLPKEK